MNKTIMQYYKLSLITAKNTQCEGIYNNFNSKLCLILQGIWKVSATQLDFRG